MEATERGPVQKQTPHDAGGTESPARQAEPAETIEVVDRRRAAREARPEQTVVVVDRDEPTPEREVTVWLLNVSEQGVSFRCRESLPERVAVKIHRDDETTVEAYVVRRREVAQGLWDYGAELVPPKTGEVPVSAVEGDEWPHRLIEIPRPKEGSGRPEVKSSRSQVGGHSSEVGRQMRNRQQVRKKRAFALAALVFFLTVILIRQGVIVSPLLPAFVAGGAICVLGWIGVHVRESPPVATRRLPEQAENEPHKR